MENEWKTWTTISQEGRQRQKTHKKYLTSLKLQWDIITHRSEWLKYKRVITPNAGWDLEKMDLPHIADGNINGTATLWQSVWQLLTKLKYRRGSNDCASGHLSQRNETHVHRKTRTAQFTAAILLPRWSLGGQSDGWLHQEDCAHGLQLAAAQRCTRGQCVTSSAGWQMPPKCQLCQVPARAANGPNVFQQVNS